MSKVIRDRVWLLTVPALIVAFVAMVALFVSAPTLATGGGGGGLRCTDGTVFQDSTQVIKEVGGAVAFTATKDVRVCFDPACGRRGRGESGASGSSSGSGRSSGASGSGGPGNSNGESDVDSSGSCSGSGSIGSSGTSGSSGGADSSGSSASGSSNDCGCPDDCDPFPNDGLFTYVYKLTNSAGSANDLIAFEIVIPASAVVSAGALGGPGVAPSNIEISSNRVEWDFFGDTIGPGEMSQELYIVSHLGPDFVGASISSAGAIDCPTTCVGPVVVCEFCDDGGGGGRSGSGSSEDSGNVMASGVSGGSSSSRTGDTACYHCPTGLASGPACSDEATSNASSGSSSEEGDGTGNGNSGNSHKPIGNLIRWMMRGLIF